MKSTLEGIITSYDSAQGNGELQFPNGPHRKFNRSLCSFDPSAGNHVTCVVRTSESSDFVIEQIHIAEKPPTPTLAEVAAILETLGIVDRQASERLANPEDYFTEEESLAEVLSTLESPSYYECDYADAGDAFAELASLSELNGKVKLLRESSAPSDEAGRILVFHVNVLGKERSVSVWFADDIAYFFNEILRQT